MKKGKSLSDWMSSALTREVSYSQSHSHSHQLLHSQNPMSSGRKKGGKRPLRSESQPVRSKTTPLTAGTLPRDCDVPWSLKYQPQSASELAVHKKKVAEVQQWLEFALSSQARHPLLLLTGPPGCGKTATLQALARDLGISLLEWVNPSSEGWRGEKEEVRPGNIALFPESQWKQFQNFLVRANRYPSLQLGGAGGQDQGVEKKVVLVEELPNTFLREPSRFRDVMNAVTPTLHYPLVFIISENHRGDSLTSSLFTKATLTALDLHTISFNPIAHTSMVKTLQKVASTECQNAGSSRKLSSSGGEHKGKFHMPPRGVIESLAESSTGDIRSAINALQFACLKDPSDLLPSTNDSFLPSQKAPRKIERERSEGSIQGVGTKERRASSEAELCAIGGRDNSLFLFRALGRILHCKRDTGSKSTGSMEEQLPDHLKEHERAPLLVNPEMVVEHTHMSPEMFVLYLHQNYIDFYQELEDIVCGVEFLSDADVLGRMWTDSQDSRASLQGYSSSVACRGLMHSNNHTPSGGRWRPLHKPQWITVNKQYREKCQAARGMFLHLGSSPHAHLWTPLELQTEILPYLAMINVPLRNPGQVSLLQSIAHLASGYHRLITETLGEKDVETEVEFTASGTGQSLHSDGTSQEGVTNTSRPPSHYPSASQMSQNSGSQSWSQDVHMGPQDGDSDVIEDFEDDLLW